MMSVEENATVPFSLRLTAKEHATLKEASAGTSMAEYARRRLFDKHVRVSHSRRRHPAEDQQLLAQLLAKFGAAGLVAAIMALLEEIRSGRIEVSDETEAQLQEACTAILSMRMDLLRVLGLRPGDQ